VKAAVNDALVVDASVFLKWYLPDEELLQEALALRESWRSGEVRFLEPDFLAVGFGHSVVRPEWRERLSRTVAARAVADFTEVSSSFTTFPSAPPLEEVAERALGLRASIYAVCYMLLAHREGVPLLTASMVFYRKVSALLDLLWLGDHWL
jgi:predicted nucleic acid-binding protein